MLIFRPVLRFPLPLQHNDSTNDCYLSLAFVDYCYCWRQIPLCACISDPDCHARDHPSEKCVADGKQYIYWQHFTFLRCRTLHAIVCPSPKIERSRKKGAYHGELKKNEIISTITKPRHPKWYPSAAGFEPKPQATPQPHGGPNLNALRSCHSYRPGVTARLNINNPIKDINYFPLPLAYFIFKINWSSWCWIVCTPEFAHSAKKRD